MRKTIEKKYTIEMNEFEYQDLLEILGMVIQTDIADLKTKSQKLFHDLEYGDLK